MHDSEIGKMLYEKIHKNNYLQNQLIFNIEENQDERTDNFVKVNLRRRKPPDFGNKNQFA